MNKRTMACVTSASKLSKTQISTLQTVLSRKLAKEVEIISLAEPSLIGGLHIEIEDWVIDTSIKKQLSDLKASLLRRKQG